MQYKKRAYKAVKASYGYGIGLIGIIYDVDDYAYIQWWFGSEICKPVKCKIHYVDDEPYFISRGQKIRMGEFITAWSDESIWGVED